MASPVASSSTSRLPPTSPMKKQLNPKSTPFDFARGDASASSSSSPPPPASTFHPLQPPPHPQQLAQGYYHYPPPNTYYQQYGGPSGPIPPPPLYPGPGQYFSPPLMASMSPHPPPSFYHPHHLHAPQQVLPFPGEPSASSPSFSNPPTASFSLPSDAGAAPDNQEMDDPTLDIAKFKRLNPPSPEDALPFEISRRARAPADLMAKYVIEGREAEVEAIKGKLVSRPSPSVSEPQIFAARKPEPESTTTSVAVEEVKDEVETPSSPSLSKTSAVPDSTPASSPPPTPSVPSTPLVDTASPTVPPPIEESPVSPPPPPKAKPSSWAAIFKSNSASPSASTSKPLPISAALPPPPAVEPLLTPRGLYNNGNLCFANAILQVLVWTEPFRALMEQLGRETKGDLKTVGTDQMGTVDSMILFLSQFLSPVQLPPFRPDLIYASLASNNRFDAMRRGTQEDAEEFLGFFLETLGEELAELEKTRKAGLTNGHLAAAAGKAAEDDDETWESVGSGGRTAKQRSMEIATTPITSIFGGRLRSTLRTPGQKDSITHEPYQRLQLDISPSSIKSIEDALASLFVAEKLSDFGPNGTTKEVRLEAKVPKVLVCHMKRFWFDDGKSRDGAGGAPRVRKLGKRVRFGKELKIRRDWMVEWREEVKYGLYAVVYHHGHQATGGHYTVSVLVDSVKDQWVHIDDTATKEISFDEVGGEEGEKGAYLLFYSRK